jgi:hypothetical protein
MASSTARRAVMSMVTAAAMVVLPALITKLARARKRQLN